MYETAGQVGQLRLMGPPPKLRTGRGAWGFKGGREMSTAISRADV